MEYPDLGVFMCPISLELLTITDNTEAFMVIGPACCRTVIFLLSTNVSAVDFCHTLKCLAGLALIPNDFILTYSNDVFFFLFEESDLVKRKERNYLFTVIYAHWSNKMAENGLNVSNGEADFMLNPCTKSLVLMVFDQAVGFESIQHKMVTWSIVNMS